MKISIKLISLFLIIPLLSGCVGAAIGAAAVGTGAIASKETTIGTEVDDTKIYWQIKGLYLNHDAQDLIAGVNVKVIEGRVNLTGKVKSLDTSISAVKLAWQPVGVKEVINEIQIIKNSSLKEIAKSKWIKTQLFTKLATGKGIRSLNYSTEVVNGTVYLMGIAQDTTELNTVTKIASTIKGVKKVVSHVRIKNDPSREL